MDEIKFDKAFSEYLNADSFLKASDCMYDLAKAAFAAGWKAAMDSAQAGPKE